MKKQIASLIFFLFISFNSFSQTVTVTIGTGTSINSGTTYPAPYGNWYWGAKNQFIIRSSELSAAGMGAGLIYSIAFDVADTNSGGGSCGMPVPLTGFEIKLKNTSQSSTTTNFDDVGLTTVWGPQTYKETIGWNIHTFGTPFYWDGSSNLLIETCFNNTCYSSNALTYYTPTTFNSSLYYRADASGVCGNATGSAINQLNRPNMQFEAAPPAPIDAGINSITSPSTGCNLSSTETVMVNVQNFGTDTIFNIDVLYRLNGGPPVLETINDTILPSNVLIYSFFTPADLSLTGVYIIDAWTQLTGDTVPGDDSLTNYPVEHLTPVTVFPYIEDFESEPTCPTGCGSPCPLIGNWVNSLNDDIDWTVDEGGTPSGNTGPNVDNTIGDATGNYLYTEASGCNLSEAVLLSPCLDINGLVNPTLSFYYHMFGANMGNLYIDINSGGIWTSFDSIIGQQQLNQIDPWLKASLDLSSFPGIIRVRFRGITDLGFQSDMAIDDIKVYDKPPNDAGVFAIDAPISGCNLTASEGVTIKVINFGADPQDTIPVAYRINGGASIVDTIFTNLNPDDTVIFTFSISADLSTLPIYIFDAWTDLGADGDNTNDSLTNYLVNTNIVFDEFTAQTGTIGTVGETGSNFYSQSFFANVSVISEVGVWLQESGVEGEVRIAIAPDNGSGNPDVNSVLWESALLNPSPVGQWFIINGLTIPVTFSAKYWVLIDGMNVGATGNSIAGTATDNTDTGENFKYSNDGGVTWTTWSAPLAIIVNSTCPVPIDAGITSFTSPSTGCGLTNSETVMVNVQNLGLDTIFSIDVYYSINGGPPVMEPINDTILPGSGLLYSFSTPADLSLTGVYIFDAWTQLTGDTVTINDSLTNYQVEHISPIVIFPYIEDFESEPTCPTGCGSPCPLTGNWINFMGDDIDWTVDEGGTPSTNTGPTVDNTTGNATGNYLYTEASGCNLTEAVLLSPCLDISSMTNSVLSFYYHMFGGNMGNLYIDIYSGGVWTVLDSLIGQQQANQSDPWLRIEIDFSSFTGIIKIRFRGVTGPGFTSDIAIDDISIYDPRPVADFTADINNNCTGALIQFTDLSSNFPTSWYWDFGDGATDTIQNPTHSYADTGTYTVSLIVSNSYGSDTIVIVDYIIIVQGPQLPACTPTVINPLTDAGIYNVSFNTINNTTGALIESYQDYSCFYFTTVIAGSKQMISVETAPPNAPAENVRAWIDFNNDGIFNNTTELVFSSDNVLQYHSGLFIIPSNAVTDTMLRMRVASDYYTVPPPTPCAQLTYGQAEDYGVTIQPNTSFPPEADFTYTILDECLGIVEFNDYSSYFPSSWSWDFGDGNSDSASPQVNNTYPSPPSPGTYNVTLIVTNSFGSDTITKSITIRSVIADFAMSGDTVYSGDNLNFTDNSMGANSWDWDFGDGGVATLQNPIYSYDSIGTYTIWLISTNTNSGCMDSISKTIVVIDPPPTWINDFENYEMIRIVPIPSSGIIHINYEINAERDMNISIYNILGQKVYDEKIVVNKRFQQTIDLSDKPKGIYFITFVTLVGGHPLGVADNEKQIVRKIILE